MNEHAPHRLGGRPDGSGLVYEPGDLDDIDTGGHVVDIDFRAIWAAIYRNRLLIAVTIVLALILGVVVTLLTTPIYRAETTVQIEQQATKVLNTEDSEPTASTLDAERFLQTQLDIIRSRALATRVAESLNLFANDSFLIAMQVEPSDVLIGALDARESKRERVLQVIENNLAVELPRESRIATISFTSPDPVLARRIANSYAENYITSNLKRRFDTSAYTRAFLDEQLVQTKQKLEESEREMIAYARGAQLIDASAGAGGSGDSSGPRSLTTSSLVQLNTSYSEARAARVAAQQRWQQASATPLLSLPEVLTNPAIQDLNRKRAELSAEYQQNLQRRKEEFPEMRQAKAQIVELDQEIARLASSIRNSIRDQYQTAVKQEQALSTNVDQLKMATLNEQDRSIRYNILKREVDTNRTLYDGLLQRFKEVSAAAGITTNNISVIDVADTPIKPVSPRMGLNLMIAGLGGIGLALLLAFAREKFDDSIRVPDDVNRKLGLSFLGSIPMLASNDTPMEALSDQRSAFSEAYFALRTMLELSSPTGLPRSILLTSSRQAEGKSTTSFAVARNFAQIGRRVLLIDGDLRKPSLHRTLNVSNAEGGFANLLAQQKKPEEVVRPSGYDNLDFIPCGPLPPSPAELLAGPALSQVLADLTQRYDLVVIDGPPVMGFADSPLLGSAADAVVFVIQANSSHRGEAKTAIKRLISSRARILGTVLTMFDAKGSGYGYYYGYSYNYGVDSATKKG